MFGNPVYAYDSEEENQLYKDHSTTDSNSDHIDSDVEDKILSHVYYQSNSQAISQPAGKPNDRSHNQQELCKDKADNDEEEEVNKREEDVKNNDDDDDDDEEEDSRYQIGSKPRKPQTPQKPAPQQQAHGDLSSDSDSESETAPARTVAAGVKHQVNTKGTVACNASSAEAVDEFLDALVTQADGGLSDMEHQHVQIDSLLSPALTHVVTLKRTRESDEYEYLDEAEIQGRNRYFMEEKEIICSRCNLPGHIARECTVVSCTLCGEQGHSSRDCRWTGTVCHRCNMRGHISAECPQKSNAYRGKAQGCSRCSAGTHHTEECASIWRRYAYGKTLPGTGSGGMQVEVVPWCYNCAAKGHFGDDCLQERTRGAFSERTAFGAKNCPVRIASVQQKQADYARGGSGHGGQGGHGGHGGHGDYQKTHINNRLNGNSRGGDHGSRNYRNDRNNDRNSGGNHDRRRYESSTHNSNNRRNDYRTADYPRSNHGNQGGGGNSGRGYEPRRAPTYTPSISRRNQNNGNNNAKPSSSHKKFKDDGSSYNANRNHNRR
ncbi:hypothetical protein LPJ66_000248 [Kickxella alabastrina]|uniref:Uncharacterized protein n=1 Tax=Kickxella alabastrina TaxID=61397 RepID=A0ACC1IWQ7_9FUNG|nr:hypothetical protein LPJ66_000248 [Kickxella alabastrina]